MTNYHAIVGLPLKRDADKNATSKNKHRSIIRDKDPLYEIALLHALNIKYSIKKEKGEEKNTCKWRISNFKVPKLKFWPTYQSIVLQDYRLNKETRGHHFISLTSGLCVCE